MEKLKIGYFADGPWSHKAFEKIIKDPLIQVQFIVPRNDTKDMTLKGFSEQYNIDYITGAKINTEEFYNKAAAYECDLFVSMSYNQIFKDRILNLPPLKTINCHAGKLPFYRGRNILNWVLINDEQEFGITVHYIDEGVDTGDIILQRTFPIDDNDTYGSLLSVAHVECANILYDTLKLFQEEKVTRTKQEDIHPVGFYCGERTVGDEIINWNQNSRAIYNFIRALYCPGSITAITHMAEDEVCVKQAKIIEGAPDYLGTPGQVVGKTPESIIVKTADNVIEITDYECDKKVRIGSRFK